MSSTVSNFTGIVNSLSRIMYVLLSDQKYPIFNELRGQDGAEGPLGRGHPPPSARDSLKGPDFGNFDALQCSTNFSWCGDISSLSAFFHTKQRSQLTVSVYRPTHSKLILPISGLSIQNSLKIFPFEKSYCEQKGLGFIDWVVSFRIPLR